MNPFSYLTLQNHEADECLSSTAKTCDEVLYESCSFTGDVVHSSPEGSTPDSNSCNQLCIEYGGIIDNFFGCAYWKFDGNKKQCTLYDSTASDCKLISGPALPSVDACAGKHHMIDAIQF